MNFFLKFCFLFGLGAAFASPVHAQTALSLADEIKKAKNGLISLTQGTYTLTGPAAFANIKNLTIDGNGSTLIQTNPTAAFLEFDSSSNITLKNFTVRYDPYPFTQGTVVSVVAGVPDIVIDTGYHDPKGWPTGKTSPAYISYSVALAFSSDGAWKPGASDGFNTTVTPVTSNDGKMHAQLSASSATRVLAVGDRVALTYRTESSFKAFDVANLTVSNVTIQGALGVGISGRFLHGNVLVDNFSIVPGPPPAPDASIPLISGTADGINVDGDLDYASIIHSHFEKIGDDGINVHTMMLGMLTALDQNTIVVVRPSAKSVNTVLHQGTVIHLLDEKTFTVLGKRSVETIVPDSAYTDDTSIANLDWRVRMFPAYYSKASVKSTWPILQSYRIFLKPSSEPLPTQATFIESGQSYPTKLLVRDNDIESLRGSGIRAQVANSTITHNVIRDVTRAGIILGSGQAWRESGAVRNAYVYNNTIENFGGSKQSLTTCATDDGSNAACYPGGIVSIPSFNDPTVATKAVPINSRIYIADNVIRNSPVPAITIFGTDGAHITGNQISNVAQAKSIVAGSTYGINASTPISITASKNIIQSKNTLQ